MLTSGMSEYPFGVLHWHRSGDQIDERLIRCPSLTPLFPPGEGYSECTARGTKGGEECVDLVRHLYYEEKIQCHCPPRCSDRIYERFLSTGQETRQCSAIQSEEVEEEETPEQEKSSADDKDNSAKVIVYVCICCSFSFAIRDDCCVIERFFAIIATLLQILPLTLLQ